MDSFKVAVFLFWVTFFANQRGCGEKLRVALLNQVISTTADETLTWLKENFTICKESWNVIHDTLLDVCAQQIVEICDAWLESEAGKHYLELIENAR
jgi:hypothetical protein